MGQSGKRLFRFGRFHLDPGEQRLLRDGSPVPLTPKTFQTLFLLVESHGRTVERGDLIRRIWPDTVVEEGNLSFHVHQARKALGGEAEEFIATVPRRGYRFVADVTETWDSDPRVQRTPETPDPVPAPAPTEASDGKEGDARQHPAPVPLWTRTGMWLAAVVALAVIIPLALDFSRAAPSESVALRATAMTGAAGWEYDPSLSPDGARVAYVWQAPAKPPHLYVRGVGGTDALQLTSHSQSVLERPRWSPDGKRIAFVRASGAMVELFSIDASGGEATLVAQPLGYGPIRGFDWAPDGKRFVFTRSPRQDAPSAIFLLDAATGNQTQITDPAGATHGDREVAFSPDGRTLAFARHPDYRGDIYRVPVEGGEPRRMTFDMVAILDVTWSADGRDIIFSSRRAGAKGSLWRIPASGGAPQPITGSQSDVRSVSVSRSGNRLVFADWIGDHNIWRIPVAGAERQKPAASPVIEWASIDSSPHISPNGAHVALASDRSGSMEIWNCNRAGKNCDQLTSFQGPHTGTPRWSPDSQWLAFTSRPEGNDDIFLANLRRDAPRRMTTNGSDDTAPSWSRDGQWIYFGSDRTGQFEVWKAPIDGQPPVQVTRNGGFAGFESHDGRVLFYTKRNAPGLWQMPVGGGPEVLVLRDDPAATCWGYWAVAEAGIYFVRRHGDSTWSLEVFDPSTRRITTVAPLPAAPGQGGPGLTIAPDGQHILISLLHRVGSNIMLLEKFL
jgi:Tol biopolymer transport system component/DNA-binding winged helix-turn-helix (wHTH) protein